MGAGTDSLAFFGTSGGTSLIGILIGAFFRTGLVRINLAAARGQTPVMADLFSGGPLFLRMFGLQLLMMVAYATGCAVFVVGMVFVMLMFCLSDYYLVDANMGLIDSMRASYEATKGQWGSLFIFGLVAFGLGGGGRLSRAASASSPRARSSPSRWRSSTRASAVVEPWRPRRSTPSSPRPVATRPRVPATVPPAAATAALLRAAAAILPPVAAATAPLRAVAVTALLRAVAAATLPGGGAPPGGGYGPPR